MNAYKPRYKVAFQAKSKIWPYKDSRLRRFFNIRGRKLVRRGFFKRYVVVLNNMKWTIARRYIRPYMRRRRAVRRRYRNIFYTKQQLRAFHGKMKEETFRNFFKTHLAQGVNRNTSFYASLERRLDVFFFRMRILPTIFACHQYIIHQGVLINDGKINSPSTLVRPGDILSICPEHWPVLYDYIRERILYRVHGKYLMLKRRYKKLRKKLWFLRYYIRGRSLMYIIWYKRRILNFFILARKQKLFKLLDTLMLNLAKILNVKELKKKTSDQLKATKWLQMFARLQVLSKTIKAFIEIENTRNKFFCHQWTLFKASLKHRFMKPISEKKKPKDKKKWKLWRTKQRKRALQISMQYKNFYLKFIYILKTISTTYLRWLSFTVKLRVFELKFYYDLFSPLKGDTKKVYNIQLRDLINNQIEQTFIEYVYIRKNILTYYQMFFRKFIKSEKLKVYKKWIAVPIKLNAKERKLIYVPYKTTLTSWLIRRRFRMRKRKRVLRLKPVHWGMPNYIHFDARTLRGMLLYAPQAKEIYYPFKCTLPKIVAFYKSLAL